MHLFFEKLLTIYWGLLISILKLFHSAFFYVMDYSYIYTIIKKQYNTMIDLPTQDKFDGTTKVQDLKGAIGKTFSDNYSSTGRSILVEVTQDGKHTISREFKSEYNNKKPQPGLYKRPSWLTWNAMFF